MNKRIISLLLAFSFLFSVAMPAFAANNTTYAALSDANQSEIVSYIGGNKLVSWETQSTVYIKQYDLQGNLLVSAQGNKQSGEITIFDGDDTVNFNASDVVQTLSMRLLPSLFALKRVGTYQVYDRITLDRQTMYLYENTGSAIRTTYSIRTFEGTIAALAAAIVVGLAIQLPIANAVVNSIISSSLGFVVGETININSQITLAADKYPLEYYGQDKTTGRKSATYNQSAKYIITETGSGRLNEVYYDGSCYFDPNDDEPTSKLLMYIVPNLYGENYEWDHT